MILSIGIYSILFSYSCQPVSGLIRRERYLQQFSRGHQTLRQPYSLLSSSDTTCSSNNSTRQVLGAYLCHSPLELLEAKTTYICIAVNPNTLFLLNRTWRKFVIRFVTKSITLPIGLHIDDHSPIVSFTLASTDSQ
jgi:hypothetical protein